MELIRQKNVATVIVFPLIDKTGDLISSAAGLDSEIDQWADGSNPNGFADCTNEATEIGTSGVYYLSLTATEMNEDYVYIKITSTTTDARSQHILIRTVVGDPLNLATTTSGRTIDVESGGTVGVDFSNINGTLDASDIGTDAITANKIATDTITSAELATTAVNEIRDAILSDSTAFAGANIASIKTQTDKLGFDAGNRINANLEAILDTLISETSAGRIAGNWDYFWDNADAQTTKDVDDVGGGGASLDAVINVVPSIPFNIDLANTKTVRLALYLIDMIDDLPSTAEITPGTITIDRSGDGGTSWTNIVNAAACSEHAGAVYYDEVFDSGTGYQSDDMIRITFKGVSVSIGGNTFEIADGTNGMIFHTRIDAGAGAGSSDWTSGEKEQIRFRLAMDGTQTDPTTSTGTVEDILTDTNEMQGKLPTNYIMGSSVLTDKDDEIDAIKAKTDNLPADPASETNVDANETKIDTIDTVVDAIKAITDNLPNSGALTDIDTGINNIEAKLPTNYIMGSSDQNDWNDDIFNISGYVTGLSTSSEVSGYVVEIITEVNENETEIDNISGYIVDTETNISGVVSDSESIVSGYIADVQVDLDNPSQYMAIITGLALESSVSGYTVEIVTEINENETEINNISGYIVDTESNIRGTDSDDLKAISDQLDVAQADLDLPDQYKAIITGLALESSVSGYIVEVVSEINGNENYLTGLSGQVSDILTDTNEIQGKLPTNYIMGSSVQSDKDDEIDAIKAKTDNLPADPASETNVDANETKIDTVDTVVDAIKAITDNLPNSGALTDIDTGINNIEAKLPTNYIMGSSVQSDKDDEIDAIKAKTDNLPVDPASETNVDANETKIDANYTAITSIQNNTTRRIVVPERLVRPDSGSKDYRIILGLYDTSGNPEVPDSTPTIQVENIAGTERLTETGMVLFTGETGQYYHDYNITSSTTLENLLVRTKVIENSVTTYHRRTTEVTEFETDLADIEAKIDILDTNVDSVVGKLPTNYIMGSSVLTDKDDEIDAIKTKTDNLPSDPASETNVDANETKIDTIDTVVDAIKAKTDNLNFDGSNNVKADLEAILDTDITETSAGRIANNWDYFFDNSDGQTTKEVDDVGGAGTGTYDWSSNEKTEIKTILGVTDTGTPDSTPSDGVLKEVQDNVDTNETKIDALQTDLDNPTQYMAIITGLSLESSVIDNQNYLTGLSGHMSDIYDDTNEMQGKLPTNYIMGSSNQTDYNDDIIAISGYIVNTESNIRGTDSDDLKALSDQLDTAQTDLDNPNQYKADVSALALEGSLSGYTVEIVSEINANETKIDTIQADLDNPTQYMAVITGLSTYDQVSGFTVETILEINANETKIDTVQADLDNPTQYQADVSSLALEASLSGYTVEIVAEINENEVEIDNISGYIVDTETSISGYIADVDFDNISGLIVESDANVSGYIVDTETNISGVVSDSEVILSGYVSDLDANVSGFAAEIVAEVDENESLLNGLTGDMDRVMGLLMRNSYMEFGWVGEEHQYLLHEVYDSPFNARVHDGSSGLTNRYFGTGTYDGSGFPITFIKVDE